jgi:hypothetical protein
MAHIGSRLYEEQKESCPYYVQPVTWTQERGKLRGSRNLSSTSMIPSLTQFSAVFSGEKAQGCSGAEHYPQHEFVSPCHVE